MSKDFQSIFNEAWQLRNQGDYEQVLAIAGENLSLAQEAQDKNAEALFLKLFAQVHSDQGELREALSYYKQLEKVYIELGNPQKQMHALRHIADTFLELGEFECADKCIIQVVDHYKHSPVNPMETANTYRIYALVLEALNRSDEAKTYWIKARDIYAEFGIEEGVKECEGYL